MGSCNKNKSDTDYSGICEDLSSSFPFLDFSKDENAHKDMIEPSELHFSISDDSEIIEFKSDWEDQGDLANLASILNLEQSGFADISNKKHIINEMTFENNQIGCNWFCTLPTNDNKVKVCNIF